MFPHLPALGGDTDRLHALGLTGGVCDDGGAAPDSRVAAGWPFFGQLVAHDVTADRSPLDHGAGEPIRNFREPRLNLECVYGSGPSGSPYLYDRDDPAKLLLGEGGHDVPRNVQGIALIGDPRNDVHLFVNRIHVALLRAHNAVVDRLRAEGVAESIVFEQARTSMIRHYQWVVLNDFLAGLVGHETLRRLEAERSGRPPPETASIPFEFADAAYRYGHSQIRESYRINAASGELRLFPDLIGFRPVVPERAVEWPLLFDVPGHPPAQRSGRIDGRMPPCLLQLPHSITGDVENESYHSLASRDLQRGLATGLPSGEAVARELGVEPLGADAIGLDGWEAETPLWFYIVREADVLGDGDRLGPVGGYIVADVLLDILDADPGSFRTVAPGWRPTLPSASGDADGFGLVDLLLLGDQPSTDHADGRDRT